MARIARGRHYIGYVEGSPTLVCFPEANQAQALNWLERGPKARRKSLELIEVTSATRVVPARPTRLVPEPTTRRPRR